MPTTSSFSPSTKSVPHWSTSGAGVAPRNTRMIYPLKGIPRQKTARISFSHRFMVPQTPSRVRKGIAEYFWKIHPFTRSCIRAVLWNLLPLSHCTGEYRHIRIFLPSGLFSGFIMGKTFAYGNGLSENFIRRPE